METSDTIKLMTLPFTTKVSIVGVGHCVIIPKNIMDALELEHHDMLTVTITKLGGKREDGRGNRKSPTGI